MKIPSERQAAADLLGLAVQVQAAVDADEPMDSGEAVAALTRMTALVLILEEVLTKAMLTKERGIPPTKT